jgi:FkbM family methyltransferase
MLFRAKDPPRASALARGAITAIMCVLSATARGAHPALLVDAILPVMREWGCGHENMETPRCISQSQGKGQVIVDIGLGTDAQETLDAVKKGFRVFGVEPNPTNWESIKAAVKRRGLLDKVRFVEPVKLYGDKWEMPMIDEPSHFDSENGMAFLIHAGADFDSGTIHISTSDSGGVLSNIAGSPGGAIEVAKMPISDMLPGWVHKVALLKIDTQGWDYRVTRSAEELILKNKVRYVQFEFSPKLMRDHTWIRRRWGPETRSMRSSTCQASVGSAST